MTGDLLQRIHDHERVERFLTAQTLTVLFSAFSFVVFGGVLLYYNRLIFFIFVLGSALYAVWVTFFLKNVVCWTILILSNGPVINRKPCSY